jgi:hypothetical protein
VDAGDFAGNPRIGPDAPPASFLSVNPAEKRERNPSMNSSTQLKTTVAVAASLCLPRRSRLKAGRGVFALCWFALCSTLQAVTPAPDGGYANGNTAEGTDALFHLTTGEKNTADGYLALFFNTSGRWNTATGSQALYTNTTGSSNTALGLDALFYNTTGNANTASGYLALFHNTAGTGNTADGYQALMSNTNGYSNTAIGESALLYNTSGWGNVAVGTYALFSNSTGHMNTAIGVSALSKNGGGTSNIAIGDSALLLNTGRNNTAVGVSTLQFNRGDFNTALGISAGRNVSTASNVISIGAGGANVSNSCFISNIRGVTTANPNAIPVLIDAQGQLGTASSSERFKKDIEPMDKASEVLLGLRPVTFHYKSDKTNTPQFGLIAEELAKVNPDLVVRDENGEIYTVRYDAVNAMLLNEFLKEHGKVEKLESAVAQLMARLKDQDAKIGKLSNQLELSKSAPETAANNQ